MNRIRKQAWMVTVSTLGIISLGPPCGTGQAASPLVSVERHAEHLNNLHQHLEQWRDQAAASPAQPASSVYYAWKAGRLKDQYFRDLEGALRQLEDPAQQEALRDFFQTDGFTFSGGRVGDLVTHVLGKRLTARPGSPAHALLAELGRALESFVTTEHETRLAQVNEARREAQEVERRKIEQRLLEQQYRQREVERILRLHYLRYYYTHSYGRSYSVPRTRTYTRTYTIAR